MADRDKFGEYLEKRAERLGLPTDPEAWKDGGLAVAATARNVTEADLIANELSAKDIPAWVDQSHAAVMLSHAQFAINPVGVRVLVPLGRLADARTALAEYRRAAPQPDAATQENEDSLRRQAVSLLMLAFFLCPLAPLWLVLSIRLAVKVKRHEAAFGPSPVTRSAVRWALVAATVAAVVGAALAAWVIHEIWG